MTKIKKTLGRNWTRYHNYYGMTHILERACSKKLHWNRETIREYTVSHAPKVNSILMRWWLEITRGYLSRIRKDLIK